MGRYRKKPLVVEAEQFWPERKPWPEGVKKAVFFTSPGGIELVGYQVETLEGVFRVFPGDWIITEIKPEKYPCKPEIFEATYEAVQEPKSGTVDTNHYRKASLASPNIGWPIIGQLCDEIDRLNAILDKLPKTADGLPRASTLRYTV